MKAEERLQLERELLDDLRKFGEEIYRDGLEGRPADYIEEGRTHFAALAASGQCKLEYVHRFHDWAQAVYESGRRQASGTKITTPQEEEHAHD